MRRMGTDTILNHYDNVMYSPVYRKYYNQSDFFNFGYWYKHTRCQKEASENLVEKLLESLPSRNGSILDVACGMGATARCLMKYYSPKDVIGINISAKQLLNCKINAPGCRFFLMNAPRLAFEDCSFDNMICIEAAFHFNTRSAFLHEAYRTLKPGGCLLLSDVILTPLARMGTGYTPIDNYVSNLEEYKQSYQRAGFQRPEIIDATNECWGGWRRHILRWLCRMLLVREITPSTFAGVMLGPILGLVVIKYYVLVSAWK